MYYRFLPHSFAGAATYGGDFVGYGQAHRQACCSFLLYSPFHGQPELQSPLQGSGHFSFSNIYQLNILDGIILTTNNLCCSCFALCYSLTPHCTMHVHTSIRASPLRCFLLRSSPAVKLCCCHCMRAFCMFIIRKPMGSDLVGIWLSSPGCEAQLEVILCNLIPNIISTMAQEALV